MKYRIAIISLFVTIIVLSVLWASEPVQKADDYFYDRALTNWMLALGMSKDSVAEIMQLPTSPEIDLETLAPLDSTKWFFVTEGYRLGIVFQYIDGSLDANCNCWFLKKKILFDLRNVKQ